MQVIGESGSGKTTLLSVLCGYDQTHSGNLQIYGKTWRANERELKLIVAFVPQDDCLFDDLTPNSALKYAFQMFFRNDERDLNAVVWDILWLVKLEKSAETVIKKLSGGERKRLSIALELVNTPQILVLDEPDSGLDIDSRNILREILENLCEFGVTVINSTHYSEDIDNRDEVVVLSKHAKPFIGSMSEYLENRNNILGKEAIGRESKREMKVPTPYDLTSKKESRHLGFWVLVRSLFFRGLRQYFSTARGLLYALGMPLLGSLCLMFVAPKIPFTDYKTAVAYVYSIICAALLLGLIATSKNSIRMTFNADRLMRLVSDWQETVRKNAGHLIYGINACFKNARGHKNNLKLDLHLCYHIYENDFVVFDKTTGCYLKHQRGKIVACLNKNLKSSRNKKDSSSREW